MGIPINRTTSQATQTNKPDDRNVKKSPSRPLKEWLISDRKIGSQEKKRFFRELHIMLKTGLELRQALDLYQSDMAKKKHKVSYQKILEHLDNGSSLSSALQHSHLFTAYDFSNIKIGEETGNIVKVLEQLYQFYKNKTEQQKAIISALSYPLLVLTASIGAVAFMLKVVVPMFQDVFKRFGNELPQLTKAIINLSSWFDANFLFMLGGILSLGLIGYQLRKYELFRSMSTTLLLNIPFLGDMIRSSQTSKLASALHLLTSSKYPLVKSVELVTEMVKFYPIEKSLKQAKNDLIQGVSLSRSLSKSGFYSRRMIAMINMAEEVNELDHVFVQIRDQSDEELKYLSSILSSVLEPILIIFIGAMVGFILIAMYLPLFQLSTNMG